MKIKDRVTFPLPEAQYVIDSVYAFAFALNDCFAETTSCNGSSKDFVEKYLKKYVKIDQNRQYSIWNYRIRNGRTGYVEVGSCDQSQNCKISENISSGACIEGQVLELSHHKNCHKECRDIKTYEFLKEGVLKKCKVGTYYNRSRSVGEGKCQKLPTEYPLARGDASVIIIWTLTFAGLAITFLVAVVFLKYRGTPMVQLAHGWRPLLIGITIMFLDTFVELERPSVIVCTFRRFILGIALTTVYGTLFMRVLSKYRIYHALLEERRTHLQQVRFDYIMIYQYIKIFRETYTFFTRFFWQIYIFTFRLEPSGACF